MSKTWKWIIIGTVALSLLIEVAVGGFIVGGILTRTRAALHSTPTVVEELQETIAETIAATIEEPTETASPTQEDAQASSSSDNNGSTDDNTAAILEAQSDDFYDYAPIIEEAWNLAHQYFVDQPLDNELLIQGAMRGMMEALGDKHSMYLSPAELTQLSITQEGTYEGIGAWVDTSGDYITIISPMAGSPAEEAGLKTGDVVLAIDGEDMTGINPDIALQKILGPAGSEIVLTIEREGEEEPLDVAIIRAEITVPSVEYEMLENDIAHIELYNFGEHTSEDFVAILQEVQDEGAKGIILDLRGNGGGYLYTAVNILSQFIEPNTPLIYQVYGDGSEEVWESVSGGIAYDIPMVVLADGGSASASEITIGALQDLDRATIIGTTTYGKGSVHYVLPLSDDNGAVQVTIAKWLTPDKRFIHEIGIEPDIVVEFDADAYEEGIDNQLEEGIEVLLEMLP